jgi:hypothetical protein
MMIRALAFSHWLDPTSLDQLHAQLKQSDAFKEAGDEDAVLKWVESR